MFRVAVMKVYLNPKPKPPNPKTPKPQNPKTLFRVAVVKVLATLALLP